MPTTDPILFPALDGAATALSLVLALLFLLLMLALIVGGVAVTVMLARVLCSAPTSARHEPARPEPASAVAGVPGSRPRGAGSSEAERDHGEDAAAQLALWRNRELVRLGVEPVAALEAALRGVDAAGVRSLVERGCKPMLAVAILLPDDGGDVARSPVDLDARPVGRGTRGDSAEAAHSLRHGSG